MTEPTFMMKAEVEQPGFGKFILEPLEQGYGQTLGNSLRRVLLASLPGAAITSMKIEGVQHQFSTIPGLKEDVIELSLNLKKIKLTLTGTGPFDLTISKKGTGTVTAADIEVPSGVTIVNPELYLGTLADKKSELNMKMTAETGYGYVTADDKKSDEIGVIAVDALFSPVIRVNYRVESTRVGRMTNLDRLVMEIWTDGTITPSDALTTSAKILVSYFAQVYQPKIAPVAVVSIPLPSFSDEVLKTRIEELDIPTRIVNALSNGGVETIGQILSVPRSDLMKIKNLGSKSLSLVEDKLKEKGIVLTIA